MASASVGSDVDTLRTRVWPRWWRLKRVPILAAVTLVAATTFAADTIVFGPETYTRARGNPVTVKKTFKVTNPSGRFLMLVLNRGVTSGVITVNGRTIFEPKDFTYKRGRAWWLDEWTGHYRGNDDWFHGFGDDTNHIRDGRDDRHDHDDEMP